MIELNQVLEAPLVSEKATRAGDLEGSVSFWVHPKATKPQIKKAVEFFFPAVTVESVRTSVLARKEVRFGQIIGHTIKKKKAFVKLAAGQQINFAELQVV